MTININNATVVVFDLDDTLYQEVEYLKSAYREIASKLLSNASNVLYEEMWARFRRKENVFLWVVESHKDLHPTLTIDYLLQLYRSHIPSITLTKATKDNLQNIKSVCHAVGLISDGRSQTQRAKLKALGLSDFFDHVIISEEFGSAKPERRNFQFFMDKYPRCTFWYVADNVSKDFVAPLELGWQTILIQGTDDNIHKYDHSNILVDYVVKSLDDLDVKYFKQQQ